MSHGVWRVGDVVRINDKWWQITHFKHGMAYFKIVPRPSPWESKSDKDPNGIKKCTCNMADLMKFGCKCGGV